MHTEIPKTQEGGIAEVWQLTYPLILSTASMTLMQFVDRIFLAWHSSDELAACVPAGILSFMFICFFLGTTSYTNVFVSQYYGGKRNAKLSVALWQGVWLAAIAAVCIVAMIPLGRYIIDASSHPETIKLLEKDYFTIITLFGGLVPLNAVLSSFFTGRGKTKTTMTINIIGNIVNLILAYTLIFGRWGCPELGIRGAVIGYIASNIVVTILFLSRIFSQENRRAHRTLRLISFHYPLFIRLIKFGVPSGVGFFIDIASFTVFVFLAGDAGKAALAANNMILTINMLAFMPILGIGMATQTLVVQYIGMHKPEIAVKTAYTGAKLALAYAIPIGLLFFLTPGFFVKFFGMGNSADLPEIMRVSYPLMKIMAFFTIFDAMNIVFADAIKGAGDTKFQMITAGSLAWLFFVPGVYSLLHIFKRPVTDAWLVGLVYVFMLATAFFLRFRSGKWKKIQVTQ